MENEAVLERIILLETITYCNATKKNVFEKIIRPLFGF